MKDRRADLIRGRAQLSGFDVKRLAARSGINLMTMYKRLRLPGTITLDELTSIDKAAGFTNEELVQMVRGFK